jgi:hypothetical protein
MLSENMKHTPTVFSLTLHTFCTLFTSRDNVSYLVLSAFIPNREWPKAGSHPGKTMQDHMNRLCSYENSIILVVFFTAGKVLTSFLLQRRGSYDQI